ncbi:MAG: cyclic-di-AMP receptor [Fimbriimonas ginsengisoli]|uniref:Cyclic-di-AMP receptor n=1 Tax=Fimbriimonas ginsengisoli TaxID=1005039 RepID=A0A931LQE6_FIMGI|nr:cyclic-di-AMP receptor [Fimbriimonas ginsengisoli]MBI3721973.1 cyclic-di-AMP receptor [Fimbriimonas ginsengisoli]
MKLVVCVVHCRDKGKITDELVRSGFKFTIVGSTGGFLREGNATLLIGVEDAEVDKVLEIAHQHCQAREQVVNVMPFEVAPTGAFLPSPVKVPVGGAVVFVVNVEQFHRY